MPPDARDPARFIAVRSHLRDRMRASALSETLQQATRGFWPKTQEVGADGWHPFSPRMPFPRGDRSLVFIRGPEPPDDGFADASPHCLDDVRVSLLLQ